MSHTRANTPRKIYCEVRFQFFDKEAAHKSGLQGPGPTGEESVDLQKATMIRCIPVEQANLGPRLPQAREGARPILDACDAFDRPDVHSLEKRSRMARESCCRIFRMSVVPASVTKLRVVCRGVVPRLGR